MKTTEAFLIMVVVALFGGIVYLLCNQMGVFSGIDIPQVRPSNAGFNPYGNGNVTLTSSNTTTSRTDMGSGMGG